MSWFGDGVERPAGMSFALRRTGVVWLSAVLAAWVSVASAGPFIAPGWGAPVFEDQFDGNGINHGVWEVGNFANQHNNELQYYHPDQVLVYDGGLHLWAERDDNWTHGRNYNSGHVRTWQEWRHGRFEVRAKIPWGQGYWPAIWLLPRGSAWPVGGELDIMENVGNNTYFVKGSYHYNWTPGSPITSNSDYITGEDFAAGYHDYAVEWEQDQIRFYVDGNQYHTIDNPIQPDPAPMSLILNLAVGGDWPGPPDGSTPFPSSFDIDYVRVWQRQETPPPPVSLLADAGFEDNGGAMDDWGVFGDSIGNVFSDWGTPRDGERSLKLYGQFNGEANVSGAYQNIAITGGSLLTAGAYTLIRSEDSVVGTVNEALMKIEFYREAGAEYGSDDFLGETAVTIADGNSPEDTWSYFELEAAAPDQAVEARLTFAFLQPATNDGGAVFVDSATMVAALLGDYNDNGLVEQGDLNLVLGNWGQAFEAVAAGWTHQRPTEGIVDQAELNAVLNNWGDSASPAFGTSAVPEPGVAALIALGVVCVRARRRDGAAMGVRDACRVSLDRHV